MQPEYLVHRQGNPAKHQVRDHFLGSPGANAVGTEFNLQPGEHLLDHRADLVVDYTAGLPASALVSPRFE